MDRVVWNDSQRLCKLELVWSAARLFKKPMLCGFSLSGWSIHTERVLYIRPIRNRCCPEDALLLLLRRKHWICLCLFSSLWNVSTVTWWRGGRTNCISKKKKVKTSLQTFQVRIHPHAPAINPPSMKVTLFTFCWYCFRVIDFTTWSFLEDVVCGALWRETFPISNTQTSGSKTTTAKSTRLYKWILQNSPVWVLLWRCCSSLI